MVSNVSSYRVRNIRIDAPDLPIGLSVGQNLHQVRPGNRGGVLIVAGVDPTVLLDGILHDLSGEPVKLQAGEVVSIDDPEAPGIVMFTNRKGRFRVDGATTGRYAIRLYAAPDKPIPIEIPSDAVGLYNVGIIQVPFELQ